MILTATTLLRFTGSQKNEHNAIVIAQGTVVAIGPIEAIVAQFPRHRVYKFKNAVIMPGLINVHTHLELPPLLGKIRSSRFSDWILNLIRTKRSLTNRNYSDAVRKNILSLIRSGTTTVGEICTHDVSPALLLKSGLRAVIYREIIGMSPSVPMKPISNNPLQLQSSRMHEGVSPHSVYTVSRALLSQIKKSASKEKLRLCMHVAESKDELRLLQGKKNGFDDLYRAAGWDTKWAPRAGSSFKYLQQNNFLSRRLLAVHAVHATSQDIKAIKYARVSVAHCPRSNHETGVGTMRLREFLDAGVTVGLGTDSLASVESLNMWDEMRFARHLHRRTGITAEEILTLATRTGARALGLSNEIGTIAPGKRADIIVVPLPKKDTGDLYEDLLRETKSCIMTMVDGKFLYRRRKH